MCIMVACLGFVKKYAQSAVLLLFDESVAVVIELLCIFEIVIFKNVLIFQVTQVSALLLAVIDYNDNLILARVAHSTMPCTYPRNLLTNSGCL